MLEVHRGDRPAVRERETVQGLDRPAEGVMPSEDVPPRAQPHILHGKARGIGCRAHGALAAQEGSQLHQQPDRDTEELHPRREGGDIEQPVRAEDEADKARPQELLEHRERGGGGERGLHALAGGELPAQRQEPVRLSACALPEDALRA